MITQCDGFVVIHLWPISENRFISVISNVSSAYGWKPSLCVLLILPIGALYAENNRDPSNDP